MTSRHCWCSCVHKIQYFSPFFPSWKLQKLPLPTRQLACVLNVPWSVTFVHCWVDVRFSCSPIIYMSLDFWKKPHRLHSHLQTQDLFLCELRVQTTEQPNNQAVHFDQDLIKVIFARWSDFISFHHKLRCLWLQILTAHQPAPSYATLARGSKHHQLKISCQAVVT